MNVYNYAGTLISVLIFVTTISSAQTSISGTIKDNNNQLPGAAVLLLQANDSTLVKGTIADVSGKFILDDVVAGTYNIHVSMIGYSRHRIKNVVVGNKEINL